MNAIELKVTQNPGVIDLNFSDLEKAIDKKLEEYEGAVFTEETKDIARSEVASLRKQKKELDDMRKTIKKEWMKPYDVFEKKLKALLERYDEPIVLIDKQVKEFDENRRREKRKAIQKAYVESVGDMSDCVPLEKIYESKWENVATSMKSIKEEISKIADNARTAVESIKAMSSEKEADAIATYKETLDLSRAMLVITTYERQKAEILAKEEERRRQEEERQRQAEIDRARAAERAAIEREAQIRKEAEVLNQKAEQDSEAIIPDAKEDAEEVLPFVQPTTRTVFYRVVATEAELENVEMAFNSIGIYFERRES